MGKTQRTRSRSPRPGTVARLELLRGATRPREILARISAGDPLELRAIGLRRVRAQAVFCDGDRLHLRSLAVCARRALLAPPNSQAALDDWLEDVVDTALTDLLDEEAEWLFLAEAPPGGVADFVREVRGAAASADARGGESGAFELLGAPLGLEPGALRRACARFNAQSVDRRRAFQRFLLDGESLAQAIETEGVAAHDVARAAREGLLLFLNTNEPERPS